MKNIKQQTTVKEKNNKKLILIIVELTLIVIILLFLLSKMIGKIGYMQTSTKNMNLVEITENDLNWDMLEQLNIFKDIERIAPGSNGQYAFKIKNATNASIIYDIQLKEINVHNINLKYKLKNGEGKYLIGNEEEGIRPERTNIENMILESNKEQLYILEWEWEDSPNDTQIGMLDTAEYILRIKIGAEYYR